MQIKYRFLDLNYDNKRIGVIHGDDDDLNKALIESQLYDVLCLGHNHTPTLKKEGKTVIINPGSLVGFTAEKGEVPITYAIYDTISNVSEIWDLENKEKITVL
jgi:uncharacterized protein